MYICSADSVVQETFRAASGVFIVRQNTQDTEFEVGGKEYKIRKGDKVMMYPPAIHKDPEIFEQPEVSNGLKTFFESSQSIDIFSMSQIFSPKACSNKLSIYQLVNYCTSENFQSRQFCTCKIPPSMGANDIS